MDQPEGIMVKPPVPGDKNKKKILCQGSGRCPVPPCETPLEFWDVHSWTFLHELFSIAISFSVKLLMT